MCLSILVQAIDMQLERYCSHYLSQSRLF